MPTTKYRTKVQEASRRGGRYRSPPPGALARGWKMAYTEKMMLDGDGDPWEGKLCGYLFSLCQGENALESAERVIARTMDGKNAATTN